MEAKHTIHEGQRDPTHLSAIELVALRSQLQLLELAEVMLYPEWSQ
jgi:hypothetical protein